MSPCDNSISNVFYHVYELRIDNTLWSEKYSSCDFLSKCNTLSNSKKKKNQKKNDREESAGVIWFPPLFPIYTGTGWHLKHTKQRGIFNNDVILP